MSRFLATVGELYEITAELVDANVSVDVETTGLNWWSDSLIGIGVSCPERLVDMYVPVESDEDALAVSKWVRKLPCKNMIGQNLKFDLHFLGIAPSELKCGQYHDTLIIAHLLDSRQRKSLDQLEARYLGTNSKRHSMLKGKGKRIWEWPDEVIADYCVNDCIVTKQLWQQLWPQLDMLELTDLYYQQLKFMDVLWRAERRGILVDRDELVRVRAILADWQNTAILDLRGQLKAQGVANWEEMNWRSPKQLSKALYDDWPWAKPQNPYVSMDGIDRSRITGVRMYNDTCTSSFLLMEKAKHPASGAISYIREMERLKGVEDDWLELSDSEGRIHTNLNMTGTRTGRLSSGKPALQNIPSDVRARMLTYAMVGGKGLTREDELNLRRLLIASPGYTFVCIDHKQQEIRMFAIMAQEPDMLKAAMTGQDIHKQVAERVWGIGDAVRRDWAKVISFGLIYGMNTGALEHRLNVPEREAKAIAQQYWTTFSRVKPWLKEVVDWCKRDGMVRYWSGRIWRETSESDMYAAANAIIQGGSADLMSVACMRCDKLLRKCGYGHLSLIVHDEALFELRSECLEEAIPLLLKTMEVEDIFGVPFFADVKIGPNYGELH